MGLSFKALNHLFCGQVKVGMLSLVHRSSRICDEEGKMSGETAVSGKFLTLSSRMKSRIDVTISLVNIISATDSWASNDYDITNLGARRNDACTAVAAI